MYNKTVTFDNFEDARIFIRNLFASTDFIHHYSLSKSRDEKTVIITYSIYTPDFIHKHFVK